MTNETSLETRLRIVLEALDASRAEIRDVIDQLKKEPPHAPGSTD